MKINPNQAGGAKWPKATLNDYFSATECSIDLKPSCIFNPISPRVLDPCNTLGGHKVPGFNLRALDCCLTLKLCVCFQKYKLTSHEKKDWSKSQKSSEILRFKNFMDLRFCHDFTFENGIYVFKKSFLAT